MKIEWEGADDFARFLRETPGVTQRDVEAALYLEGEEMMSVAKRRTPVDTGNLRASGHVKLPETRGGRVEVTLAYGTEYAVYVHEITTSQHPSGQAKFLESAVLEKQKTMADRMKSTVLDRIGRRGYGGGA